MTDTARVNPGVPSTRVVDVHAHAVPPDLMTALRARGSGSPLPEMGAGRRVRFGSRLTPAVLTALTDIRERFAEMDRTGVDVQVVAPWMELSPDELEPAGVGAFLRLLNDGMVELAARHPDRLRALVLLDRGSPAAAAAELVRTAGLPGVVGVELALGGRGAPLHDPAWDRLWAAASEHRSFVLLHPWRAGYPSGSAELRLGDIVGNPAQSTAVVGAMALAGVFDRFPELRVCVVHGGGFLPYQAGRFDAIARLLPGRSEAAHSPPSPALRRLYYDSLTHSAEALSWLVDFAGSGHVLLGSDFPFPTGDDAAVQAVEGARSLTAADRAAVLGGNACRLFGC